MVKIDWIALFKDYHPFGFYAFGDYDWSNTDYLAGQDEVFLVPVKWKIQWSWEIMVLDPWFKKIKH